MKRKIFSIILTFALCAGLAVPVIAEVEPKTIPSITIYLESANCNATLTNVFDRYAEDWVSAMYENDDYRDAFRWYTFTLNGTVTFDKDVVIKYYGDNSVVSKNIKAGETVKVSDYRKFGREYAEDENTSYWYFPDSEVSGNNVSNFQYVFYPVYYFWVDNNNTHSEYFYSPGEPGSYPYKNSFNHYENSDEEWKAWDWFVRSRAVASSVPAPAPESEIKVLVNGTAVVFDQPPIIENGRTLVPMRAIFEAMGADVDWAPSTQTVTAVRGDITVTLKIGSKELIKNGKSIELDVSAKIVNGRTLAPARAVAESFGADVKWTQATRTVTITE